LYDCLPITTRKPEREKELSAFSAVIHPRREKENSALVKVCQTAMTGAFKQGCKGQQKKFLQIHQQQKEGQ